MKVNAAGLALIKAHEGLRLVAYKDAVGVWTIGYGHTSMAGAPAVSRGMVIDSAQAEDILSHDLIKYENAVIRALAGRSVTDNEFAAMVSLCYNIGPGNFNKSSVLRYVLAGNKQAAANAFRAWNKAGGKVLRGLVARREQERTLFLS